MKVKQPMQVFRTNSFYYYANELRKHITDEDETEKMDFTDIFWAELEAMVRHNEIVIININSKPRLGKSTEAIAIARKIFDLLKRIKGKKGEFNLHNIARDHQEYSRMMRDPKTEHTVLVVDEFNELENTGENITAENALRKQFSDVQAARYVHRVCCSPTDIIDPNADIMLQLVSHDERTMISHNKLFYRYHEGAIEDTRLLGYVNIYVGDIIKTWLTVRDSFYRVEKTKADKIKIRRAAEMDFYTNYVIKKHEKMELITREGIFRPRLLDFAEPIKNTVQALRPLTKLCKSIDKDIIRNILIAEIRKAKLVTSIFGDEFETRHAQGILNGMVQLQKMNRDLNKLEALYKEEKIDTNVYNYRKDEMVSIMQTICSAVDSQMAELDKCIEINKDYHNKQ